MKKVILCLISLVSFSQTNLIITENGIINKDTNEILNSNINTLPTTYSFFIVKHNGFEGVYKEVHLGSSQAQCYAPLLKTNSNYKIYNVYCFDREVENEGKKIKPIFYIYNLMGIRLKEFTFEGVDHYIPSYPEIKNNSLIFRNIKILFPKINKASNGNIVCSIPGNNFFDSNFDLINCSVENLDKMEEELKKNDFSAKQYYDIELLHNTLLSHPLTPKTLTQYNNIAYYLQQAGANEEAIYLLEKIIKKFPNRTVAYINLGDAYWALGEKAKARKAYSTYIEQMCAKGLEKKIPRKVLERVKSRK